MHSAKFIQVGNLVLGLAHVVSVSFCDGAAALTMVGGQVYTFEGDDARGLLAFFAPPAQ